MNFYAIRMCQEMRNEHMSKRTENKTCRVMARTATEHGPTHVRCGVRE
jgi:hypothetical protein